jgi:hypothetical protein
MAYLQLAPVVIRSLDRYRVLYKLPLLAVFQLQLLHGHHLKILHPCLPLVPLFLRKESLIPPFQPGHWFQRLGGKLVASLTQTHAYAHP